MLKQIILRSRIKVANGKLDELRAKDQDFATRQVAMKQREAELEAAINEVTAETSPEDQAVLDTQVAELETESEALTTELEQHGESKKKLEDEIQQLQAELDELEARLDVNAPQPQSNPAPQANDERKNETMTKRVKFFSGISQEARTEMMKRDDVQKFLERVRSFKGQTRAVTATELLIPDVFLGLLRENLVNYSKLLSKVMVRTVGGTSRMNITGAMPEGVWTEAVGALNELALTFSQIEVDGYKVGGFIPIPNATLEDSDINLASEIMTAISYAIGRALDKAIVYGTGTKMPVGIVTRLAQTSQPAYWESSAPAWTDLHTSHVLKFDPSAMTAQQFFANLIGYLGVAKSDYASGDKIWLMNEDTFTALQVKAVQYDSSGFLVSKQAGTFPIVGGEIILLDFIPDNDIVGGYGLLYLLAERAGISLASSTDVRFIEDQTVFKGTARYDGKPIFGEGFVVVNINNSNPTTSLSFESDVANTVATPYGLPVAGTYAATQTVNLYCLTPGAKIYYTVDGSTPDDTDTLFTGPITVEATTTIKAIAYYNGVASAVFSEAITISG